MNEEELAKNPQLDFFQVSKRARGDVGAGKGNGTMAQKNRSGVPEFLTPHAHFCFLLTLHASSSF